MFRWIVSADEKGQRADGPETVVRFATAQGPEAADLYIDLVAGSTDPAAEPALCLGATSPARACGISVSRHDPGDLDHAVWRCHLHVPPASDPTADDVVVFDLEADQIPPCRVILRRTTCRLHTAMVENDRDEKRRVPAQAYAALLWQGWGRYTEVVALKRLNAGRSGNAVLVVRPRLRDPAATELSLESSGPPGVLEGTWGSSLVVKTGPPREVRKEWDRCRTFLADRMHPFLARCEEYLPIRPVGWPGEAADEPAQVTLVSSFLGGDLIRTEPLEHAIRGLTDAGACTRLLDRLYAILGPWHQSGGARPLGEWRRVYRNRPNGWLLFGKFDFRLDRAEADVLGRHDYTAGLQWDTAFIAHEHLRDYLLGTREQEGLLHTVRSLSAHFSLTHGDLNPRNALCEGDNVWLIDFEHTGVAPTLADFARMEANLRLWCLTLAPGGHNIGDAAARFERHLLDHFHGGEGGLEPLRALAGPLGADAAELLKIAHCIAHVRRLALPYCVADYADHRDYLAVLYLTVLNLLQYAGERAAAPENYRVLVSLAWVLEDVLGRILGLPPYAERPVPIDHRFLLSADWLREPDAPWRVRYVLEREDGRQALASVAATRGVLQGAQHHFLDVFDHTLLVLAYLEAILHNPVEALFDPAALDREVTAALARQGIALPRSTDAHADDLVADLRPLVPQIEACFGPQLDEDGVLLLKWLALLHDVGKPGTRRVSKDGVRFLGHEAYGLDLLRDLLRALFPKKKLRRRMERLIAFHHVPHQIVFHYDNHPEDLVALTAGLRKSEIGLSELSFLARYRNPKRDTYQEDLPLLILHGYADRLASRGVPIGEVARIFLAVLAACPIYEGLWARDWRRRKCDRKVSKRLRRQRGMDKANWDTYWRVVMPQLRPLHEALCRSREAVGEPEPSVEEVLELAQRILEELLGAGDAG